jgi:uncharacterized protein (DUF362 family)
MSHQPVQAPAQARVSVARGEGPYANTRRALERFDLSMARGRRVLLKPNVGRVAPAGSGIVTHPQVVAAAIDAFREAGALVAVGESPIVGVRMREAYEAAGYEEVAGPRRCPLIDMDRRPCVEVALPDGQAIRSLKVCADVMEADYVVSVPVMKMHMHTGVTLAVKNMKGCLWRRSKVELHMLPPVPQSATKSLDVAIADMASVLRPRLAIVDGTVGMEGLGPSAGRPKPLDAVVVGDDAFAADAVACQLMGVDAATIPHLRLGAERGYGTIDLRQIAVLPDDWRDAVSPFAPPPNSLTIEFPNITVLDANSCSACQSTLLLFLTRYRDRIFDYFPAHTRIHIAIGKGHAEVPDATLLVGNCTVCHRQRGVFVPGCPPVGSQILAALAAGPSSSAEHQQNPKGENRETPGTS